MDADALKSVPLFEGLSRKERQHVAELMDEVDVQEGKHLIEEGKLGWEFFVVESGEVEVTAKGETLATLGPGSFFGELALMGEERRTATVVATEPTRLIVMTAPVFSRLQGEFPEVAARIQEAVRTYRR